MKFKTETVDLGVFDYQIRNPNTFQRGSQVKGDSCEAICCFLSSLINITPAQNTYLSYTGYP